MLLCSTRDDTSLRLIDLRQNAITSTFGLDNVHYIHTCTNTCTNTCIIPFVSPTVASISVPTGQELVSGMFHFIYLFLRE